MAAGVYTEVTDAAILQTWRDSIAGVVSDLERIVHSDDLLYPLERLLEVMIEAGVDHSDAAKIVVFGASKRRDLPGSVRQRDTTHHNCALRYAVYCRSYANGAPVRADSMSALKQRLASIWKIDTFSLGDGAEDGQHAWNIQFAPSRRSGSWPREYQHVTPQVLQALLRALQKEGGQDDFFDKGADRVYVKVLSHPPPSLGDGGMSPSATALDTAPAAMCTDEEGSGMGQQDATRNAPVTVCGVELDSLLVTSERRRFSDQAWLHFYWLLFMASGFRRILTALDDRLHYPPIRACGASPVFAGTLFDTGNDENVKRMMQRARTDAGQRGINDPLNIDVGERYLGAQGCAGRIGAFSIGGGVAHLLLPSRALIMFHERGRDILRIACRVVQRMLESEQEHRGGAFNPEERWDLGLPWLQDVRRHEGTIISSAELYRTGVSRVMMDVEVSPRLDDLTDAQCLMAAFELLLDAGVPGLEFPARIDATRPTILVSPATLFSSVRQLVGLGVNQIDRFFPERGFKDEGSTARRAEASHATAGSSSTATTAAVSEPSVRPVSRSGQARVALASRSEAAADALRVNTAVAATGVTAEYAGGAWTGSAQWLRDLCRREGAWPLLVIAQLRPLDGHRAEVGPSQAARLDRIALRRINGEVGPRVVGVVQQLVEAGWLHNIERDSSAPDIYVVPKDRFLELPSLLAAALDLWGQCELTGFGLAQAQSAVAPSELPLQQARAQLQYLQQLHTLLSQVPSQLAGLYEVLHRWSVTRVEESANSGVLCELATHVRRLEERIARLQEEDDALRRQAEQLRSSFTPEQLAVLMAHLGAKPK